jgi:hypothetical protein
MSCDPLRLLRASFITLALHTGGLRSVTGAGAFTGMVLFTGEGHGAGALAGVAHGTGGRAGGRGPVGAVRVIGDRAAAGSGLFVELHSALEGASDIDRARLRAVLRNEDLI